MLNLVNTPQAVFCARRANWITSSVPRKFTFRQLFSDLRLSDAAQCSTESLECASASYSSSAQTKMLRGEVAAKNTNARTEVLANVGKSNAIAATAKGALAPRCSVFRAHQKIQRFVVASEQPGGKVADPM